jgi:hypothetical protein
MEGKSMMRFLSRWLMLALFLMTGSAVLAQATYPTAASGVRVPGTVPLQCDSSGANCGPVSGANPATVQGNIADGVTDSGNGVKIAGVARSGALSSVTTGQRVSINADTTGNLLIGITASSAAPVDSGTTVGTIFTRTNAGVSTLLGTVGYVWNGTNTFTQRGDANGTVTQPGLSATFWNYTSGATSILSNTTTAVTIKAAAGASVRNYIDSCQMTTTAFGASVPVVIRDGAAGTVIWSIVVPAGGVLQPYSVTFSPALPSTANTLLEVATPTANTSGTVNLNCRGHTGT